jgi:hypothetical protein
MFEYDEKRDCYCCNGKGFEVSGVSRRSYSSNEFCGTPHVRPCSVCHGRGWQIVKVDCDTGKERIVF